MSYCKECNKNIPDNKDSLSPVGSWYCHDCKKVKIQAMFFIFLIVVFPILLYYLIRKDYHLFDADLGMVIIFILWWALLGIIYHYRNKISEKNHIITELNEEFKLDNKLKNIQEKNENGSLFYYKLLSGIKDANNKE